MSILEEKPEDVNISSEPIGKPEVIGEPNGSEEEAQPKQINPIDLAIQDLYNAKSEMTKGDEKRKLHDVREAMQHLHNFTRDRLSKSSNNAGYTIEGVKTLIAEAKVLENKACEHRRNENFVQAIRVFEEAYKKMGKAMELRYIDVGEEEDLDWKHEWIGAQLYFSKKHLLSRIKKRRIGRRVVFDGITFYGKPKFWRKYFEDIQRIKSTFLLNSRYDLVAKWKHEIENLTKIINKPIPTNKSMIISLDNMNLLTSNEIQNTLIQIFW